MTILRISYPSFTLKRNRHSPLQTLFETSSLYQAAPATLLKKSLWHRCFPVNFAKFLRTPFFTEHLWWLLLYAKAILKQIKVTQ